MSDPSLHQPAPRAHAQHDADALDYQHFIAGQDPVHVAAADWLVRMGEGLDEEEEARLGAWREASPAHAQALRQLEQMMARVEALPPPDAGDPAASGDGPAYPYNPSGVDCIFAPGAHAASARQAAGLRRRRRSMGVAAMLCITAFGGWWGWNLWQQPTFSQTFVTTRGEQRQIELPDGSRVWMDTDTQADIKLYRSHREVLLPQGQAHFAVHADPRRPFEVQAGPLRVTVVGTRFTVRNTSSGLASNGIGVMVEEGRVRVAPEADPRQAVLLTAGQAVTANSGGHLGGVTQTATGAAADASAWREGRVNFAGVTLAQAVAEFERYGDTGLTLHDARVAALRVRGSFDLHRVDAFASALPQVLPVRLKPGTGGKTEIVSAAAP